MMANKMHTYTHSNTHTHTMLEHKHTHMQVHNTGIIDKTSIDATLIMFSNTLMNFLIAVQPNGIIPNVFSSKS